jgi:prepilin signal peptidase PulO-like enzyme (type II secretory pathway)
MTVLALAVFGLIIGSFINALVWRIHEQHRSKKQDKSLSIVHGRSLCPHCRHQLAAKDLIPLFSWLTLKGKCRYCHKPIGWQYPAVEASTALLFTISYIYWPYGWNTVGWVNFMAWLVILSGFVALIVYDLRWMLLPNRIVYPLIILAAALGIFNLFFAEWINSILELLLSIAIGGGIFYLLFVISSGRWIGGGDVKLGFLLGILLADPIKAFMTLLGASLLGTLIILPGIITKKLSAKSHIPFGPFLIVAGIIVYLFGNTIIQGYKDFLLISS